jgi:hypothetical protein
MVLAEAAAVPGVAVTGCRSLQDVHAWLRTVLADTAAASRPRSPGLTGLAVQPDVRSALETSGTRPPPVPDRGAWNRHPPWPKAP